MTALAPMYTQGTWQLAANDSEDVIKDNSQKRAFSYRGMQACANATYTS